MSIKLGDNIEITGPQPNDSRYLNVSVPWVDEDEVNAALLGGVGGVRYTGLTVNIGGAEYWYKDGIEDVDLILKESAGGGLLNWSGSTSNAIGTYISVSGICAQENLTFDGNNLLESADINDDVEFRAMNINITGDTARATILADMDAGGMMGMYAYSSGHTGSIWGESTSGSSLLWASDTSEKLLIGTHKAASPVKIYAGDSNNVLNICSTNIEALHSIQLCNGKQMEMFPAVNDDDRGDFVWYTSGGTETHRLWTDSDATADKFYVRFSGDSLQTRCMIHTGNIDQFAGGVAVSGTTDNGLLSYINATGDICSEPNLTFSGTDLILNNGITNNFCIACGNDTHAAKHSWTTGVYSVSVNGGDMLLDAQGAVCLCANGGDVEVIGDQSISLFSGNAEILTDSDIRFCSGSKNIYMCSSTTTPNSLNILGQTLLATGSQCAGDVQVKGGTGYITSIEEVCGGYASVVGGYACTVAADGAAVGGDAIICGGDACHTGTGWACGGCVKIYGGLGTGTGTNNDGSVYLYNGTATKFRTCTTGTLTTGTHCSSVASNSPYHCSSICSCTPVACATTCMRAPFIYSTGMVCAGGNLCAVGCVGVGTNICFLQGATRTISVQTATDGGNGDYLVICGACGATDSTPGVGGAGILCGGNGGCDNAGGVGAIGGYGFVVGGAGGGASGTGTAGCGGRAIIRGGVGGTAYQGGHGGSVEICGGVGGDGADEGDGGHVYICSGNGPSGCDGCVYLYQDAGLKFQTCSTGTQTTGVHCITTCSRSPVHCSTTRAQSPIVCATTCMRTATLCTTGTHYYGGSGKAVCDTVGYLCLGGASGVYLQYGTTVNMYTTTTTSYLRYAGSTKINTLTNGVCVTGCGYATDWIASSDCRLKTCIIPISNALSTVDALCGVNYQLCADELGVNRIGLIAQDVEKVLPEVVTHTTMENIEKGSLEEPNEFDEVLGITYDKLTAVLIEAVKELKTQNECLQLQINELRNN